MGRSVKGPFLLAVAACLSACGDGGTAPTPAPGPPPGAGPARAPLLERAIAAVGGREALAAVRTIESAAAVQNGPLKLTSRAQMLLPDAYRDEVDTGEARFVRAWRDGKGFGALDGLAYELSDDERASLAESLRLTALAMLVHLDAEHGATVRELSPEPGEERLEVKFATEPKGPYELRFDATTTRLRSVAWQMTVVGARGRSPARLVFDDWRPVDGGLQAAFSAKLFVGDAKEPSSSSATTTLSLNGTLLRDAFEAPTGEAPVLSRDLGDETVALWERKGDDGPGLADAEEKLGAFVSNRGLVRRGPLFRLLGDDDAAAAVGVAVVPPRAETRPSTTSSDSLRVTTRPAGRVLTLAVRGDGDKELRAGVARLRAEAERRGYAGAGPFRVVRWSDAVAQMQLPVRPR